MVTNADNSSRQSPGNQVAEPVTLTVRSTEIRTILWLLDAGAEEPSGTDTGIPDSVGKAEKIVVVGEGWSARSSLGRDGRPSASFRAKLRGHLGTHTGGILAELGDAATDEAAVDLARRAWSRLTAEAVAAYKLAQLIDDLAGKLQLERSRLDRCQAMALLALASAAGQGAQGFAAALERHVVDGLISAPCASYLARHRESIDWSATSMSDRWAMSATVSAVMRAAKLPDPNPIRTAESFVGYRWAKLVGRLSGVVLDLDPASLRDLLSAEALADVAKRLYASNAYRPGAERILTEAGHGELVDRVARETATETEGTLNALLARLDDRHATDRSATGLAQTLYEVLQILRASRRDSDLARAGQHALALSEGNDEVRATLLTVIGAVMKDARRPSDFLELAGDQPREWESGISPWARVALAVERSNALRLTGRADIALETLITLVPSDLDELRADDRRLFRRNVAILRRETGAADSALRELTGLLAEATNDDERFALLQSLANVAQFLSDASLALAYLNEALDLATGPRAGDRPYLMASLATTQAALGLPLTNLRAILDSASDPLTVLAVGAAAAAVVERDEAGLDSTLIGEVLSRLASIGATAQAHGDRMVELNAMRGAGAILDVVNPDAAAEVWSELVARRGVEHPDPLELAALAHHCFRAGDRRRARDFLLRIPDALALELGGTTDIGTVLDATGRLNAKFRLLGDDVLTGDQPDLSDIRLVAELRRDQLGRMRGRTRRHPEPSVDPSALNTTDLAPAHGILWVLEWLDTTPGILGLITRMDGAGRTSVAPLPPISIDPIELARRLRARLNGWLAANPRDPLDHLPWRSAQDWLRAALQDARHGDHLVVIEHEAVSGLPWHAMTDVPWTTSYAASWTAMVRARARPRTDLQRVGHVSVAAARDSTALTSIFDESLARARAWSRDRGLRFDEASGPHADESATLDLLRRCDIVTLHCHGLYKPDERDIALMLAANGRLPPQRAHDVEQRIGHQLSWRDLQNLDAGPAVVLSAACSSGTSIVAGLGERLGIYGALRYAGTRTVIAPAWDGLAADVVDQLDQVRDHLVAGDSPAHAVKAVANRAAATLPSWRARVLAVDGDWT